MRILIVGLGSVGRRHLRNLRQLGIDRIDAFRARGNDVPEADWVTVFTDLDAALAQQPVAVVIANPTSLHMPVALKAARAGCHLFIEKPLSHSQEGLDDLAAIVRDRKLVAFPAYTLRFHPSLLEARQRIVGGGIGRLLSIRAEVGQYLPDWHPGEDYRLGYSARRDLGGGVLLDLSHELDYVMWLAGSVRRVGAVLSRVSDLEIDTPDIAEIVMQFSSGAVGSIHLDYVERSYCRACRITGTKGTIVIDLLCAELRYYDATTSSFEVLRAHSFDRNDTFLAEMKHFLSCVQGQESPVISLEDGIRVQQLITTVERSARDGRFVEHSRAESSA